MPRPPASPTALAALLATLALAGCGGDGEDEAGRTATVAAREGIEIVAGEYSFDPETVVLEGGAGAAELTLDNQGSLAHNLRLFDGEEELGGTPTFAGGEERSVELELGPGSYRMVCTVANHEELGMVGELTIR